MSSSFHVLKDSKDPLGRGGVPSRSTVPDTSAAHKYCQWELSRRHLELQALNSGLHQVKTSWLETQRIELKSLKQDINKILKWLDHSENVQLRKIGHMKSVIKQKQKEMETKWGKNPAWKSYKDEELNEKEKNNNDNIDNIDPSSTVVPDLLEPTGENTNNDQNHQNQTEADGEETGVLMEPWKQQLLRDYEKEEQDSERGGAGELLQG